MSSLRVGLSSALCAALAAGLSMSACARFGYDVYAVGDGGPGGPDAADPSDAPPGTPDAPPGTPDAPPGTPDAAPAPDAATTSGQELALTTGSEDSDDPAIAYTGDGYSIVWSDTRNANRELYLQRVVNRALKGTNVRLTNATGYSGFPSVAWSGSELAVSWEDSRLGTSDEVYYSRFDASGTVSIGAQNPLSNAFGLAYDPYVIWTGSNFAVAWEDGGNNQSDIYLVNVNSQNQPSGTPVRRTSASGASILPQIAWNGGGFGITWEDRRTGTSQAYFARSTSAGDATGTDGPAISSGGTAFGPSIAWNGSEYGVAYEDTRSGTSEIYLQLIKADGTLDGTALSLTAGSGTSCTESKLVWTGSRWAVAYSCAGVVLMAELTGPPLVPVVSAVVGGTGSAASPDMAWSGSAMGVTWQDRRAGNWDVYFREMVLP